MADEAPKKDTKSTPKKSTQTKTKATRSKRGRPPKAHLDQKLAELVTLVGGSLLIAGQARGDAKLIYDGNVILENQTKLVDTLVKAASESPAVHRALEVLVTTSTVGEIASVVGAIAVPILANHGVLPREAASFFTSDLPPESPERPKVVDLNPDDEPKPKAAKKEEPKGKADGDN